MMNANKPARAELQRVTYEPSLVRRTITPVVASTLLLAATTAVLWFIETRLPQEHLIFIYFAPTALIAIRFGSRSAMAMAIGAAFAAAFLLYPPRFSFMVDSFLDAMELVLFSLLALLASQVVSGFAGDRHITRRRVWRARPLWFSRLSNRSRGGAGAVARSATPDQNV